MASSTSTRSLRPSGPRLRAWLTAEGRALVLGAGAVASVPVVVSAVRAIQEHWAPLGDRAEMVARGYDVFSSHPPLLGPYSASSGVLGQTTYNLGPLLHWFLAIPAHIGGYAPPLWVAATNIACVVISLALARRRGGTGFMLGTAVVILVMTASLVSLTYSDVWNPSPALLPLMLP